MPMARVNGGEIYYEEAGSGPPMILSPGGLAHGVNFFRHVLEPLSDGHRVIVYDRRFGGRSRSPLVVLTWELISQDVVGLMDALHIERADLGGGATGAAIALACAARYPDRVRAIFPCNINGGIITTAVMMLPLYKSLQMAVRDGVRSVVEAYVSEGHPPFQDDAGPFVPAQVTYDLEYRETLAAMPASEFAQIMRESIHALFDGRYVTVGVTEAMLRNIRTPTLIMHGNGDDIHPKSIAQEIHRLIPGSQWSDVPSFLPQHKEQGNYVRRVHEFLAGVDGN